MRDCAPAIRCADDLKHPPNRIRECLQVLRRSSRREQSELLSRARNYQSRRPQRLGQDHADELADWPDQALARRKVAGYSKGMRQRIRLAQAIAHHPSVLVLDEPLNGLDPMARAESIALFEAIAKQGMHVIISSHILEE